LHRLPPIVYSRPAIPPMAPGRRSPTISSAPAAQHRSLLPERLATAPCSSIASEHRLSPCPVAADVRRLSPMRRSRIRCRGRFGSLDLIADRLEALKVLPLRTAPG